MNMICKHYSLHSCCKVGPHVTAWSDDDNNKANNDHYVTTADHEDSLYPEELSEYSYSLCKERVNRPDEEEWVYYETQEKPDARDMPEAEPKEDPYSHDPNAPEYPDTPKDPEMLEEENEEYDWPTTEMAGPIADEHWNPKMTRLEDNEPSSTMHDQMTLDEVYEWLQEPSDQVVFDWYDQPDREDNKKQQRLHRLELRRNYWTGDLGPDF